MAWTVGQIQNQVEVLTGAKNLSDKVIAWTNRVLMQLGTRVYWTKQVYSETLGGAVQTNVITGQWFSWTTWATRDVVNIHHIIYDTEKVLVRQAPQDFYGNFHGLNASYSAVSPGHYALPEWTKYTDGSSNEYLIPKLVAFPLYTTATDCFTAHYLAAPAKVTGAASTNWILDKYGKTVLAGVLRLAKLFQGDLQGYAMWQQVYMTGITDMIRNEEAVVASIPHYRGVVPQMVMRGGA